MINKKRRDFLEKYAVPLVLLATVLLIQVFNPSKDLLSYKNITLILYQSAVLGLISLGLALIMICGETDMSIAGIVGLIGATFSMSLALGLDPWTGVLLSAAVGIGFGVIEGFLVAKAKISSFVITVSIMFIGMGIEKMYNQGLTIWIKERDVINLGNLGIAGMPVLAWVFILCYIIWYFVVYRTKFGFGLRITGENVQAAKEVGIRTQRLKIAAFIFAGLLYTIGSIIEPIRTSGSIIYAGNNYLLPAFAACFLGSAMFVPGRINILGTFVGAIFMSIITNFLTFLAVPYYIIPFLQGLLLLGSVIFANIQNREIKQNKI